MRQGVTVERLSVSRAMTKSHYVPHEIRTPVWVRAREWSDKAIAFYGAVLMDETRPDVSRLTAARELLDRAWGKAPQVIVGDDARPVRVDVRSIASEDRVRLELALARALAIGGAVDAQYTDDSGDTVLDGGARSVDALTTAPQSGDAPGAVDCEHAREREANSR